MKGGIGDLGDTLSSVCRKPGVVFKAVSCPVKKGDTLMNFGALPDAFG
jgi:hypothetical protein